MCEIAAGRKDANALYVYYSWNESAFPTGGQRMLFTSNHDKNAWEGTEYELFGDAREAATVLSFVGEGTPLIYNGQEAGNRKRLAFFSLSAIEQEQAFQLVVELQNGDRRVHLQDMITAWEWSTGRSL